MNRDLETSEGFELVLTRRATRKVKLGVARLRCGKRAIKIGAEAAAGQVVGQHVGWTPRGSRLFSSGP